jgi:hypothetical protein
MIVLAAEVRFLGMFCLDYLAVCRKGRQARDPGYSKLL